MSVENERYIERQNFMADINSREKESASKIRELQSIRLSEIRSLSDSLEKSKKLVIEKDQELISCKVKIEMLEKNARFTDVEELENMQYFKGKKELEIEFETENTNLRERVHMLEKEIANSNDRDCSNDEIIENLKVVVENLEFERDFCVEKMNEIISMKSALEEAVLKVQTENIELTKKLEKLEGKQN